MQIDISGPGFVFAPNPASVTRGTPSHAAFIDGKLYYTSLPGRKLNSFDPATRAVRTFTLGAWAGFGGGRLVDVSQVGCLDPGDRDGVGDVCDNCRTTANPNQKNSDPDALGDACDADDDNDGILDTKDNCTIAPNRLQEDLDGDRVGDACDNFPSVRNPLQGSAPGVKVGFCVDERLLYDLRLAGLDRVIAKFDGGRPWDSFGHCIGNCPPDVLEDIQEGTDVATRYLDRCLVNGALTKDGVRTFLELFPGNSAKNLDTYMDLVIKPLGAKGVPAR